MENLTAKILTAAWREDEACWCPHGSSEEGHKRQPFVFEKLPLFVFNVSLDSKRDRLSC